VAAQVLVTLGADLDRVRQQVISTVQGKPGQDSRNVGRVATASCHLTENMTGTSSRSNPVARMIRSAVAKFGLFVPEPVFVPVPLTRGLRALSA